MVYRNGSLTGGHGRVRIGSLRLKTAPAATAIFKMKTILCIKAMHTLHKGHAHAGTQGR